VAQTSQAQSSRPPHRIEVRVRNVGQLFNSMDPSPFIEKELDAEAEEFIVGWAKELPSDEDVMLAFHVVDLEDAAVMQAVLAEAMQNFFTYKLQLTRRRLGLMTRNGWRDLGRGMLFLAGSIVIANLLEPYAGNPSWGIIKESVIIGGWVAMWRPMEIFLYERWPLQRLCALYAKLARAPVTVVQAS
jgi:hypothetical protein